VWRELEDDEPAQGGGCPERSRGQKPEGAYPPPTYLCFSFVKPTLRLRVVHIFAFEILTLLCVMFPAGDMGQDAGDEILSAEGVFHF
jgi:hypothetical protein